MEREIKTLANQEDQIVLVPKAQERLIEKDGLMVISSPGSATAEDLDHRRIREERLDVLSVVK